MEKRNFARGSAWHLAPLLAITLAALGGQACTDMTGPSDIPGPIAVPDGGYAYTGFDSSGAVIVRGWLTLDLTSHAAVTGLWHLMGNRESAGPQTGDGQLEGSMTSDELQLNLNPGSYDNNVFLAGSIAYSAFRGRWSYSGFAGPVNQGTFEALQR